jgi:endonuclease YncB( thermonuclease family)
MILIQKLHELVRRGAFFPRLCWLLIVLCAADARAELEVSDYRGWVMTVLSGDTIRVLDGSNRMTRVRLKSIDAPEKNQPFGDLSRKHLASLLIGKEVKIKANKADDQGNILGQVWTAPADCDGCDESLDVNLAQLQAGLAWWSSKFARQQSKRERKDYESAEQSARQQRAGLWSDPAPIAPWLWQNSEQQTATGEEN